MTQSLKVEWKCVFWDSGGQCVPWDNSWDTDNAIVVCRQLGLNSACKG